MKNKEVKKTVVAEHFLMMWEEEGIVSLYVFSAFDVQRKNCSQHIMNNLGQICVVMIIIIAALQTVK